MSASSRRSSATRPTTWTAPAPAAQSRLPWRRGNPRPTSWQRARPTSCSATSRTSPTRSRPSPAARDGATPNPSQATHRWGRSRGRLWNETRHAEQSRVAPRLRPPTDGAGPAAPAPIMRLVSVWLHVLGLAAQRDFALVPRLGRALVEGQDPAHALRRIAWVDRLVLLLAVAIAYLGVAVSRA